VTPFANVFKDIASSGRHTPIVEDVPELTLADIYVAHHQRLVSIRYCEDEEIRIALLTYRNELRALWRKSSDWGDADRVHRALYRYTIRVDARLAINEARSRADVRHVQADGHRNLMLQLVGVWHGAMAVGHTSSG